MKIAISGTANTGKTTLIKDFLDVYQKFKTPEKTYRDIIVENKLEHSSNTTKNTQAAICDFIYNEITTNKDEFVVYDRCLLDNLIYTIMGLVNGNETVDDIDWLKECHKKCIDSMRKIDIIFWVPFSTAIPIEEDSLRDTSIEFITSVNSFFESVYNSFVTSNDEKSQKILSNFFDLNDMPPIIKLESTSRIGRLTEIGHYIDPETCRAVAPQGIDEILSSVDDENLKKLIEEQQKLTEQKQKNSAIISDNTKLV